MLTLLFGWKEESGRDVTKHYIQIEAVKGDAGCDKDVRGRGGKTVDLSKIVIPTACGTELKEF